MATITSYLQQCLWGDHYAPASEQEARANTTILACDEHESLRVAHPELAVCEPGCGHGPNRNSLRYYSASPSAQERAQCPSCGVYDHPNAQQAVIALTSEPASGDGIDTPDRVMIGHVTCVGCGHQFISRGV